MLDIALTAAGSFVLGAGLSYIWCRTHPIGTEVDVLRLTRDYAELYHRMHEREAELFALLSASHMQAIAVDRRKEEDG